MPKDTRAKVNLSPEAYKTLEIEAMLRGESLKDTASMLILQAACPKCREILDIMTKPPRGEIAQVSGSKIEKAIKGPISKSHKGEIANIPKGQMELAQEKGDKKAKMTFKDDLEAQVIACELWEKGERSIRKIANTLGYIGTAREQQVRRWFKEQINSGRISIEGQSKEYSANIIF